MHTHTIVEHCRHIEKEKHVFMDPSIRILESFLPIWEEMMNSYQKFLPNAALRSAEGNPKKAEYISRRLLNPGTKRVCLRASFRADTAHENSRVWMVSASVGLENGPSIPVKHGLQS